MIRLQFENFKLLELLSFKNKSIPRTWIIDKCFADWHEFASQESNVYAFQGRFDFWYFLGHILPMVYCKLQPTDGMYNYNQRTFWEGGKFACRPTEQALPNSIWLYPNECIFVSATNRCIRSIVIPASDIPNRSNWDLLKRKYYSF